MSTKNDNSTLKSFFTKNVNTIALVVALLAIAVVLSITTNGIFSSFRNLSNLFRQMSVVTIVASGIFLVILCGNIDLSVGSMVGMLGGIAAIAMTKWHWGTIETILLVLLIGVLIGSMHGYLVAYVKVPAFIVTLGGYMAYRGLLVRITNGATISNLNPAFAKIGQAYLSKTAGWIFAALVIILFIYTTILKRRMRSKFSLKNTSILYDVVKFIILSAILLVFVYLMNAYEGLPFPVLIMLGMVAIVTIIAEKTSFGRSVYAVGGSSEAARYSGIHVSRVAFTTFVISGLTAAIASVVYTARLNAATTQAGYLLEMDAIAAVVIGGTSLAGGIGNATKVMLGAILMAMIDNGMSLLNVQSEWQLVVKGAVLVLAVTLDVMSNKKRY
jgi:D-xylose transport system permease protein